MKKWNESVHDRRNNSENRQKTNSKNYQYKNELDKFNKVITLTYRQTSGRLTSMG